jgi:hypothetical protein
MRAWWRNPIGTGLEHRADPRAREALVQPQRTEAHAIAGSGPRNEDGAPIREGGNTITA